ncbi:hypothetical protein VTK56DRAFT_10029 [Thermocarpiscus australiensis]
MPTVTTFANFVVSNLGPVTTTFAAPASCITGTGNLEVGFSASPLDDLWQTDCGPLAGSVGQCQPSGAAIEAFYSSNYLSASPGFLPYYSPGIVCPAGWTTAGVTSRNTDGSPGSASGAFSFPAPTETEPSFLQQITALAQVIDPGETVAVCCPSGYTIPPAALYCYSVLPSSVYQPSAGSSFCQERGPMADVKTVNMTLTVNGLSRSTQVLEILGTVPMTVTSTTFSPAQATHLVGVNVFPMVALVHKAADLSVTSTGGGPATSSNPANSLRPTSSGSLGIWPVVAVAIAITAGAALMFPL